MTLSDVDGSKMNEEIDEAVESQYAISEDDVQMWNDFVLLREDGSEEQINDARNLIVERFLHLVEKASERMAAKLPPTVDKHDLFMAGSIGLIDAINKFDHTRGIKFETYCARRISGAMLDDLRKYDWVPRLIRNRTHQLNRYRDELETSLKRKATDEELAEYMDITLEEYHSRVREVSNVKTMVSLDRKWDDDDDNEMSHLDTLTDTRMKDPLEELQRNEIKSLALRGLSEKEKLILVMYYYENLNFKEIGAVLDISESRVCQIHNQTLNLLREKFNSREVTAF